MRTAPILIFVVVTGTGGEICLTHAMKLLGEVHDFRPRAIVSFVVRALRVSWLWLGVLLMTASFFSFLTMLSWFPVSFVIPATSLAYVAGAFGAKIFLGEQLNATRWAGILLICFGVAMAWVDDLPSSLHWPSAFITIRLAILGWRSVLCSITSWESIRRGDFFERRIKSQAILLATILASPSETPLLRSAC